MTAGALDRCTPVEQGVQLYAAIAASGTETELVVYPREGHIVVERDHALDQIRRTTDWFVRHLGPATDIGGWPAAASVTDGPSPRVRRTLWARGRPGARSRSEVCPMRSEIHVHAGQRPAGRPRSWRSSPGSLPSQAAPGVFLRGDLATTPFTTVRGDVVDSLIGGAYRFNGKSIASEGIGWDLVTLFLVVPALLVVLPAVARGSLRASLFATGILVVLPLPVRRICDVPGLRAALRRVRRDHRPEPVTGLGLLHRAPRPSSIAGPHRRDASRDAP